MSSEKLVYIQTIVTERELSDLKRVTGTDSTKDALINAVEYRIANAGTIVKKVKK